MNLDAQAERYAQADAVQMREPEFAEFHDKHRGLWHGPWCHLRGEQIEVDAEAFHADCYACPCKETCSGPYG